MTSTSLPGNLTASSFPHIETPITLNQVRLKNRIVVPAHTTNFGERHLPSARHVEYHRQRARGGPGAIIFELVRVSDNAFGRPQGVGGFLPGSTDAFRRVADAVHSEGVPLIGQVAMGAGGSRANLSALVRSALLRSDGRRRRSRPARCRGAT